MYSCHDLDREMAEWGHIEPDLSGGVYHEHISSDFSHMELCQDPRKPPMRADPKMTKICDFYPHTFARFLSGRPDDFLEVDFYPDPYIRDRGFHFFLLPLRGAVILARSRCFWDVWNID